MLYRGTVQLRGRRLAHLQIMVSGGTKRANLRPEGRDLMSTRSADRYDMLYPEPNTHSRPTVITPT